MCSSGVIPQRRILLDHHREDDERLHSTQDLNIVIASLLCSFLVPVIELAHRLGDVRSRLMRIALDHDHGLMAADAFHGRQIDSSLDEMRDGRVPQGVADDLRGIEACALDGSHEGLADVVRVTRGGCPCRELHPAVLMMKSAEDRPRGDVTERLDRTNKRRILTQG